jgi:hypothetical protein
MPSIVVAVATVVSVVREDEPSVLVGVERRSERVAEPAVPPIERVYRPEGRVDVRRERIL